MHLSKGPRVNESGERNFSHILTFLLGLWRSQTQEEQGNTWRLFLTVSSVSCSCLKDGAKESAQEANASEEQ